MLIKEVELHNFRQYKGTNKISFQTDDIKNIILVSGKNGNGKTNFLISLVWCLYGKDIEKVDEYFKDYIVKQYGYQKYIANSLNNLSKNKGESIFYVSITLNDLHISNLHCNEIKITRKYDINKPNNPETLEILLDGQANELFKDINKEHFIRDFLIPIEAAKFFFFDAEKIVSLAEANQIEERKELSKAYSEVLGIKKYEDLKLSLSKLQDKFKEESATPKDRQSLIRLRGDVEATEIEIETKKTKIDELQQLIHFKRHEVNQIQEKLIKEGNAISSEEVKELQDRNALVEQQVEDAKSKLKELLELAPFAINGDNLLQIMEQVDKEANYRSFKFREEEIENKSEEIIEDIEKNREGNIWVDVRIREFYNDQIRKLVRKHFVEGEDTSTEAIDILHEFTEANRREVNELLSTLKHSYKDLFKTVTRDYNNFKYEGEQITRKLRNAESNAADPITESYRKKKGTLDFEISAHELEIETLNKEIGAEQNKATNFKGEIAELTKKVNIADQYQQKDALATRLIRELTDFIIAYKAEKKKSLEEKILQGLATLMHTLEVKSVVVEMIAEDIDINLYNSRNEVIPKESLSKGQQQLYATALLKALVEESEINFPVFIDSPMQKFDLEHARNIIKNFYPFISKQVVIFPLLGKELTEKEFSYIKKNVSQCYLIHKVGDSSEFLPVVENALFEEYQTLYPND